VTSPDERPAARNGETYFFRDHDQFTLLQLRLLPELIALQRETRTLRLCSAGCSSGEEVYSLAMLIDMLLPQRDAWKIFILGLDIDRSALEKARAARYTQWSFRSMPPSHKQRYFTQQGAQWQLDESIREMVTLRQADLIRQSFPDDELREMDLILCRNVFIYFKDRIVTEVADKLAASLRDGGYLVSGHTELIGHPVKRLQSRLFAEGVVYQRMTGALPEASPVVSACRPPPVMAPEIPTVPIVVPDAACLLATARSLADTGQYDQAEQACNQAMRLAPLVPGAYFLLAQLAQLKGAFDRAAHLLDQALYLAPDDIAACLERAALWERSEHPQQAQRLRLAALDLARARPGDETVEPYDTTAAEIVQWLSKSSRL